MEPLEFDGRTFHVEKILSENLHLIYRMGLTPRVREYKFQRTPRTDALENSLENLPNVIWLLNWNMDMEPVSYEPRRAAFIMRRDGQNVAGLHNDFASPSTRGMLLVIEPSFIITEQYYRLAKLNLLLDEDA